MNQNLDKISDLLDIVICPACQPERKLKLTLKPDNSAFKCEVCKRLYPIRDGIPALLVEEATIEDDRFAAPSA